MGVRHVDRQIVSDQVRIVLLEDAGHIDRSSAALGELSAAEHEILVGGYVIGEVQAALAHEYGRPDYRMERDVVLAYEIVMFDLWVLPELLPVVRPADDLRVLYGGAEVSYDRVEPDIDHLPVPSFHGHGHSPAHISGDRPVVQALVQPVLREGLDVGPPVVLPRDILQKPLPESAQLQEEMLRLPYLGHVAALYAVGLLQVSRLERRAAGVALVAPDVDRAACGAHPLDITVGKEPAAVGAIILVGLLGVKISVAQKVQEEFLDHFVMGIAVCLVEKGILYAQVLDRLLVDLMVPFGHRLRSGVLFFGRDGYRGSVLVGTAHHQDLVAGKPVVPAEYIRRQKGTGHVSQVYLSVCVRPGDVNAYF